MFWALLESPMRPPSSPPFRFCVLGLNRLTCVNPVKFVPGQFFVTEQFFNCSSKKNVLKKIIMPYIMIWLPVTCMTYNICQCSWLWKEHTYRSTADVQYISYVGSRNAMLCKMRGSEKNQPMGTRVYWLNSYPKKVSRRAGLFHLQSPSCRKILAQPPFCT